MKKKTSLLGAYADGGSLSGKIGAATGAASTLVDIIDQGQGPYGAPKAGTAGLKGALSGAGAGAAIGSIVPGIGTAVGAVVGGLAGGVGAFLGAKKDQRIAKEEDRLMNKKKLDASLAQYGARVANDPSLVRGNLASTYFENGGGLSRGKDYGSKDKPYPSVESSDFAGGGRSYPIPIHADAVDALRLAGLHGRSDVKAKVYSKYPDLKKADGGPLDPTKPLHKLGETLRPGTISKVGNTITTYSKEVGLPTDFGGADYTERNYVTANTATIPPKVYTGPTSNQPFPLRAPHITMNEARTTEEFKDLLGADYFTRDMDDINKRLHGSGLKFNSQESKYQQGVQASRTRENGGSLAKSYMGKF